MNFNYVFHTPFGYAALLYSINPFPVIVPCHRVIKSDGSCGGFGGGRDPKMRIPALEKRQSSHLRISSR